MGQASKKGDEGLKQKDQIQLTQDFKTGKYNVLIATNVAEEGLDIAECNVVVFYDNSASVIQLIQRAGRTGRLGRGKVIYLYTTGTSDERNHQTAKRKKESFKKKFGKPSSQVLKYQKLSIEQIKQTDQVKKELDRNRLDKCIPHSHIIRISPTINELYDLESALSLEFGLNLQIGLFDVYFSAKNVEIGFDILNAKDISIEANNILFLKRIFNKQRKVSKYLIFLDISQILPSEQKKIAYQAKEFRELLKINLVLFKGVDTLHIKIRTILKKFAKDHIRL